MTPDKEPDASAAPSAMAVLASTRTAVVLLALTTLAAIVGMVLPDPIAWKLIYGRVWFHVLLGALGANLLACMVWRKRISAGRAWSLIMHLGLALVLAGAMVTLITSQRGYIRAFEGRTATHFLPAGQDSRTGTMLPLGFTLKLVDFRLVHYPPVDYLLVQRPDTDNPDRLRIEPGRELPVPGTGGTLTDVKVISATKLTMRFTYDGTGDGALDVTGANGMTWHVPAEVGSIAKLSGTDLAVGVLRFEPAFTLDLKTKTVTSRSKDPINPAVQIVVFDGENRREGSERWLFAKSRRPDAGPMMHRKEEGSTALTAVAVTPGGNKAVYLEAGANTVCPWMPGARVMFQHGHRQIKEYESQVQVLKDGKVVAEHVIQVNSPLVYDGVKISQSGYDQRAQRYSDLGVSRDSGVWFVYAGFLATTIGLMGRLYLKPALRELRTRSTREGGGSGEA